jgi:hypothetical protein
MADEFEKNVFVKIDDYEMVLTRINNLNQNLKAAKKLLNEIKDIKEDEKSEIESWDKELQAMLNKVEYITKTMARSG